MIYMGIDPGKKGGIALIDEREGGEKKVTVYPYTDGTLKELCGSLAGKSALCIVEKVGAMPKQGVTSTFHFGQSFGYILGVLEAFRIPYQLVTPKTWKRHFSLTDDKKRSVETVKRLFPNTSLLPTERCRVESDSTQTDTLKELCKDLEEKRFDITSEFLGTGDYWVFPSHTNAGELFHRYVTQDRVRILEMDGEKITDLIGIIDEYVDNDNKVYFLNRRHTLNGDTLTVEVYVTNERNETTTLADWEEDVGVWELKNARHIGVGRFKSPASSRGLSAVYGVPLNYGCEEIEAKIFNDLAMIETEFERAESKIFADPMTLRKGVGKNGQEEWQMPEGMFPINHRAGETGANIDIFSPAIRYSEYKDKLLDDMQQYEQQVGTDRGFLTPFDSGTATTATEIRRANASTIALIDKIHTAIKNGVEMTLAADAVFLNIAPDLYTLKFDFYDSFEDADAQYQRLANAVDRGVAEKSDELQWLFPNLTQEEIEEKLARISETQSVNTDKMDLFLKDLTFEKKGGEISAPHIERRIDLKKETFQMRISKDTRADLDKVAKHYNLSASATVDMLIAKETRLIDSQTNKGVETSNGKS